MAELCAEWETRVVELRRRLEKAAETHPSADYYLYCIAAHMEMAEDIIVSFGNDEIVFSSEMRHQLVHAQRSRDFRALSNWSHVDGKVGKTKYTQDEYWLLFRQVSKRFGGIGEACVSLREKLVSKKSNYWMFGRMLEKYGHNVMDDLQNWTDSNISFGTPSEIDGYVHSGELPIAGGTPPISLIEYRKSAKFTDLDHIDPVTANFIEN